MRLWKRTLRSMASVTLVLGCATITLRSSEPTYIGVDKCKLCHKVEYESWKELKHAGAFSLLEPERQSDAECLKCHATGGTAEMPGVQCEACHGPGGGYKSIKVMKDRDAALAAGLIIPDEKTCMGCHAQAPHEVPPFDYETAKQSGLHAKKKDADGE